MASVALPRLAPRCALLLALCLTPLPAVAQDNAPPPPLTLEEAVRLARAHNRALANARLETDKAHARVQAGRTHRWPLIEFSTTAGQLITPVSFTFPQGFLGVLPGLGALPPADMRYDLPRRPTAAVTAMVAQPLTQQRRIGIALDQGRVAEQLASAQATATEQAVTLGVRRAYYAVAQSDAALGDALEALALYREIDRLMRSYTAERTVLDADALDAAARLAQQEHQVAALRRTRTSQQEQLNALLGRDLATPFAVERAPEAAGEEFDLAAASAAALVQRADVEQARLKQQQADLDVRLARAARVPDVSLALSYVSTANIDFVPHQIATAGVLVRWEPWTWGRREHEVAEKRITARQAGTAVSDAEQQALLEVRACFRRLQDARTLVPVARQAQDAARERLRVTTTRFREEAALVRDVLQQEEALAAATLRHDQARLAYWTARAEFLDAVGDRGRQ